MKQCARCEKAYPLENYSPNKNTLDGKQSYCKQCQSAVTQASRNKRIAKDPEYKTIRQLQAKRYADKNPHKIRMWNLAKHGITVEQYDKLLREQKGACAICRTPHKDEKGKRLHVDHDHACCPGAKSCGKCVRGLLCGYCNTGIGGLRDDMKLVLKAFIYLKIKSSGKRTA